MIQKTLTRYKISSNSFIISSYDVGNPSYWVIHDKDNLQWDQFGKGQLTSYIKYAHSVLLGRISRMTDLEKHFSQDDEKQLMFMVESLIHAKKILQEESDKK